MLKIHSSFHAWERLFEILIIVASIFFIGGTKQVQAADFCTSSGTGTWTGVSWSCGHMPTTTDVVTIGLSSVVTLNTDTAVLGDITINGTLDTSSSNYALNIATLTIGSTGTLTANHSLITVSGGVAATIPLTLNSGGTFNAGTSKILITGGNTTTLNSGSFTGSNKLYDLTLSTAGAMKTLGADLTAQNIVRLGVGTDVNSQAGQLTLSSFHLTAGYFYVEDNTNTTIVMSTGTITLNGTDTSGANEGMLGIFSHPSALSNHGVITQNTGIVEIASDADVVAIYGTPIFTNTIKFNPVLTTADRTYTISGGTTTLSNTSLVVAPSGGYELSFGGSGASFGSTGTVLVQGSNGSHSGLSTSIALGRLSIDTTGILDGNSATVTLNSSTAPLISINSGGAFNAGTSTIYVTSGATIVLNGGTGTFTGANALYNYMQNGTSSATKSLGANLEAKNVFSVLYGVIDTTVSNYSLTAGYMYIPNSVACSTPTDPNCGAATQSAGQVGMTFNSSVITLTGTDTSGAVTTRTDNKGATTTGLTSLLYRGASLAFFTSTSASIVVKANGSVTLFAGTAVSFVDFSFSPVLSANCTYTLGVTPTQTGNVTTNPSSASPPTTYTMTIPGLTVGATKTLTVLGDTYTTTSFGANFSVGFVSIGTGGILGPGSTTLTLTGTTGTLMSLSGSGVFSGGTSTVNITGSGSNTVNTAGFTGTNRLYSLTVNVSGVTKTLGGDIEMSNTTTVSLGTLDTSTSNYALTTGLFVIASIASAGFNARASTITLNGTSGTLLTKGASGVYTGGSSTLVINPNADVILFGGGTATLGATNLTPTLTANHTYTLGVAPTMTNSTFTINPTAASGTPTLTVALSTTSTIGATGTIVIRGSGTATGKLDTTSASSFAFTAGFIDIESAGIFVANNSSITLSSTTGTMLTLNGTGIFSGGTSTVNLTGSGSNTINTAGFTGSNRLYNLTVNITGVTKSLGADIEMANTTTVTLGILDTSGSNYALTTGLFVLASSASAGFNARASTITLTGTSGTLFSKGSSGAFTVGSSNFKVTSASGTPTLLSVAVTFHILTIDSTATVINAGVAITIDDAAGAKLYVKNGVLNDSGLGIATTASTTNTLQIDSGGTLCLGGTAGANTAATCDSGATSLNARGIPTFSSYSISTCVAGVCPTVIFLSNIAIGATQIPATITYGTIKFLPVLATSGKTYTFSASTTTLNGNLFINPSGAAFLLTVNMAGTLNVGGATTIQRGGANATTTFSTNTSNALNTGSLVVGGGGCSGTTCTFTAGSSAIGVTGISGTLVTLGTGGVFTAGTSTVTLSGNGTATVNSGSPSFYNLTSSGTGTKSLGAAITVTNNFTISSSVFNDAGFQITGNGTGTFSMSNSTTLQLGTVGTATTFPTSFTNAHISLNTGSTVIYNATVSQTISGVPTYGNLQLSAASGTSTKTLGAATTINGSLTIDASNTLDDTGFQITGNGTGTFSMGASSVLKLGTTGTATTFPTSFTNAHISLNTGSTVIYNATVSQTISGVPTYGNLQLSAASGTPTKTLGAATTINGSLTIDASNTLDASSGNNYQISLGGNFTNNGAFTARNGTVLISGTVQQTFTGTFTSSSALYDLTITNNSGSDASDNERTGFVASVVFSGSLTSTHNYTITTPSVRIEYHSGSTYTCANINWNGQASGTKIFFRNSATSGTWLLVVTGTQTAVLYVNVSRSDASGGNAIIANGTDYNAGNNINWTFPVVVSGTANGNNGATVKVAINTSVNATTGTISSGSWSITLSGGSPVGGDIITVWVDSVSDANEATAVTKYSAGDVSGMVLNTNVLTIGSNQNTSLTVSNLSTYSSSTNEDVMQSVSSGALSVQGTGNTYSSPTLSILSGSTLTVGTTESLTTGLLSVAGTLTSVGNAAYTLTGNSGTLFTRGGTFTPATSTVTLSGNGDAQINSGAISFYNLTSSGTGIKSVSASAALTFASGGTLAVSAGTFDPVTALVASGSNTLTVAGTIRVEAGTFGGSYPSGFGSVTLSSGSTVDYFANGAQVISSSISPYYNLTTSTGGTKTLGGDMTVSNVVSIGTGTTLSGGTAALTLSGTTGTPFADSGAFSPGTGTVSYTGNNASGNTTIAGESYYNLAVNNASETYILGGATAIDAAGTLTITAGTFDVSSQNLSNSGATSISGTFADSSASGTTIFGGAVTINSGGIWSTTGNPVFTFRGGFVENSSSGFTSGSGLYTFDTNAQTLSGSQPFTITNLANAITSSSGLTFSGSNPTVGTLTQGTNAVLTFSGSMPTITTLTATASGNTVVYAATSSQTIKPITYFNLTKSGAGGTAALGGDTSVNNIVNVASGTLDAGAHALGVSDLSIAFGATLLGQSSVITVGENWTNGGTFTAGTSEVLLNSAATATVTGATTFYDLTITHTAAKEVDFATSGTSIITVSRFFVAEGHSGALIKLYSTGAGTHWHFKPTATATIDYVDVKDGGCETGSITMHPFSSVDSGHNDACWSFFSLHPYVYKITNANTVEVYDSTSTLVKTIQLVGDYNSVQPTAVAVDPVFGKLYVTTTNHGAELQIIDITDSDVTHWAYSSSVDLSISGDTNVTTRGVRVDSVGTVVVFGSTSSSGGVFFIDRSSNTNQEMHSTSSASDIVGDIYEHSGTYSSQATSGYAYVYNDHTAQLYTYPYFSDGVTLRVNEVANGLSGYSTPAALAVHATVGGNVYLLLAAAPHTVYFFPVNATTPESITLVPSASTAISVTITDIAAAQFGGGDYAYLAAGDGLYKVSSFTSPTATQTNAVAAGLSSVTYDSNSSLVFGVSGANSTLYSFTP